jgi:hypothetical protein
MFNVQNVKGWYLAAVSNVKGWYVMALLDKDGSPVGASRNVKGW